MTEVGIVGEGAREQAIKWKLEQEGGANVHLLPTDVPQSLDEAREKKLDLTIVGPENPLITGIVDRFQEKGLRIFGPTAAAAFHEDDKAASYEFMVRHNIPAPHSLIFDNPDDAIKAFKSAQEWGKVAKPVVKRVGALGGKGVTLPDTDEEAERNIRAAFASGDQKILLQQKLFGKEISVIAFCDGEKVVPMTPAADYKRLKDGNFGPNTGGMGAFAPVPWVSSELINRVTDTILQPAVTGMAEEGKPFVGALYAGLMVSKFGSHLLPLNLEFNVRLGDPEAEVLIMSMESDLLPVIHACIDGNLKPDMLSFKSGAAACVVLASEGYPDQIISGRPIKNLEKFDGPDFQAFKAGVEKVGDEFLAQKGRAVVVTAYSKARPPLPALDMAAIKVYRTIGDSWQDGISFKGMQLRSDIGANAEIPPSFQV